MHAALPSVRARDATFCVVPSPQRQNRQWRPLTSPAAAIGQPSCRPVLPPPAARPDGLASSTRRRYGQRLFVQQHMHWRRRGRTCQPSAALAEALAFVEVSPARDFAAAMLAVAGSVCLIKFFDTLERLGLIDKVRQQR